MAWAGWTEDALAVFEKRRLEWKAKGTVREHRLRDESTTRGRPKKPKPPKPIYLPECDVLSACLEVLSVHPAVAFAWRQNTGLAFSQRQAVRFSFKGCSDILGALKGGRFLAVETKATGKTASDDQQAFLDAVNAGGGLGVCVDDPQKLIDVLERAAADEL